MLQDPILRRRDAGLQAWERWAPWLALALLLAVALYDALVLRPGFAGYDEEAQLDLLQAGREGLPLAWRFAYGSLHRHLLALLVHAFGPGLGVLRLPSLLAVAAEPFLLYAWLKPRLGERSALWAGLAALLCTATFARARMLLSPALLPALFLAHAVALDRLRRPWQQALFGASLALCLLDYEGWALALMYLLPSWAFSLWRQRGRLELAAGLAGLAAGLVTVAMLQGSFAAYAAARHAVSAPDLSLIVQAWSNTWGLVSAGPRMPFSGASGWPLPPPWTWPLALAGAWPLRRRSPGLLALLAVGCLPLALTLTSQEPHRLSLALLGWAALAGAGAAELGRQAWGRWALAMLLAFGLLSESRAFLRRDPAGSARLYGRSQALALAVEALKRMPQPSHELIDGLGPYDDGAFRFLLDAHRVPRAPGGPPVALIHEGYAPALWSRPGARIFQVAGGPKVLLCFPNDELRARLRRVGADTAGPRRLRLLATPAVIAAADQAWLMDLKGHPDPWSRTIVWEDWLHASLQDRHLDLAGVDLLLSEPLVSGWAPDLLAAELSPSDPVRALRCSAKALAVDPRRSAWSPEERRARY